MTKDGTTRNLESSQEPHFLTNIPLETTRAGLAQLLPIAGNACEHLGAVRFAMDDKPGLAAPWHDSLKSGGRLSSAEVEIGPLKTDVRWFGGQN